MEDKPLPCPEEWPVKAYNHRQFLNSVAARTIRVQCELEEPEFRLENMGVHNTVVFFGSARAVPAEEAARDLARVEAEMDGAEGLSKAEKKARLDAAKAKVRLSKYYDIAVDLAGRLTRWSLDFKYSHERFYVCSGGGPGIMEAANRGAAQAGGRSIGLGISLPFEQGVNEFVTRELAFEFHYFFVRKYWFLYPAKAMVVFPGGFGTMDELFEMLTLVQTRKISKPLPIVLFGSEYWNDVINFEKYVEWGVISPRDLDLFHLSDDVEETFDYLVKELDEHYVKHH